MHLVRFLMSLTRMFNDILLSENRFVGLLCMSLNGIDQCALDKTSVFLESSFLVKKILQRLFSHGFSHGV